MHLLASLCVGFATALAVGLSMRRLPSLRLRRRARPESSSREQWLIQAGLRVTPVQFVMASAGAGGATFVLLFLLTGVPMVSLAPALLVTVVPRLYFANVREKRMSAVQRAWPDGLRDLIASISSGMSLQRAVEQLATSGPAPLQDAFERFSFLARTVGMVPALEIVKEALADPTSDRVIEVLILAHERGGTIVLDILRHVAQATTRDVWTLEAIQTEQLEQKINARVVFLLPWLVLVAMTLRDGPFRDFYRSPAGALVIGLGAVLSALGIWLVTRLGDGEDEDRVFGGASYRSRTS